MGVHALSILGAARIHAEPAVVCWSSALHTIQTLPRLLAEFWAQSQGLVRQVLPLALEVIISSYTLPACYMLPENKALPHQRAFVQADPYIWDFKKSFILDQSVSEYMASLAGQMVKNLPLGQDGESKGNPLQFSCLGNAQMEETGRLQSMGWQSRTQMNNWH